MTACVTNNFPVVLITVLAKLHITYSSQRPVRSIQGKNCVKKMQSMLNDILNIY